MMLMMLGICNTNTKTVMCCHGRYFLLSVCLIVGDVNLDYFMKVISVGFLHCEVAIFYLYLVNSLGETC